MSTVIAKFKVDAVKQNNADKPEEGSTVSLTPVYSGSPENENFYKWTPGGQISLSTVNQSAAAAFTAGQEKYVYFTDRPLKSLELEGD